MRMIDEDEIGLKEKPEDIRYIKILHQNEIRSTVSVGKRLHSKLCHNRVLQTRKWAGSSLPGGAWKRVKSTPRARPGAPPTTGLLVVLSPRQIQCHYSHHATGIYMRM